MNHSSPLSTSRIFGFLFVHLLVLCSGVVWATIRFQEIELSHRPPAVRSKPMTVRPLYDDPVVVSDDDLQRVLDKLQPRFRGPAPKINHVDHALRMWGVEATFATEDECLSGVEMRELLLDHRQFRRTWGDNTRPLLRMTDTGTVVRVQQGASTSSHVDHTLATMAETGTPLDYPVITTAGELPLSSLLDYSLESFSLNQVEYEWSTLVFALYLADRDGWFSAEGQYITFDTLADRLMRQRMAKGVCRGQHRVHTLVMLLRIDSHKPILSPAGRERVTDWLSDATQRLVSTQSAEGFWSGDWPGHEYDGANSADSSKLSAHALRLLVTGHVLEWWALAPAELLPPRESIYRAATWLVSEIDDLSPAQVRQHYTYLTHAGRALALWRGRFPHECLLLSRASR